MRETFLPNFTYRFKVSVGVSLVMDVCHGGEDLTEEYSSLVLGQSVLRNDVVKQLATRAVLREKTTTGLKELLRKKLLITDQFKLWLNV